MCHHVCETGSTREVVAPRPLKRSRTFAWISRSTLRVVGLIRLIFNNTLNCKFQTIELVHATDMTWWRDRCTHGVPSAPPCPPLATIEYVYTYINIFVYVHTYTHVYTSKYLFCSYVYMHASITCKYFLSFFLSWDVKTRLNHWTEWVNNTHTITTQTITHTFFFVPLHESWLKTWRVKWCEKFVHASSSVTTWKIEK